MTRSVFLVEDDDALRSSLCKTLSALGLSMIAASSGDQALDYLSEHPDACNVVVLDLNMPGLGGMITCRRIREMYPHLAILVLTVRNHEEDKIAAFDAGADDYVTKPFQLGELFARIRAALRRARLLQDNEETPIEIGDIRMEPAQHRVLKRGEMLHLTPKEFDLLHLLMRHVGRPLSHQFLLASIWGPTYRDEREYLRTYMNQLRRKVEDEPSHPRYLLTENYIGYRFHFTEN